MGATGRQRGKVEQIQEILTEPVPGTQEVLANGKAKMNGMGVDKIDKSMEKDENIFLFIPNVIG
jgi:hypothetical protein